MKKYFLLLILTLITITNLNAANCRSECAGCPEIYESNGECYCNVTGEWTACGF